MVDTYATTIFCSVHGLFNGTLPLFSATVHFRIGTPHQVLNGTFGTTSAPVFLDSVACKGSEKTLLDCRTGSRLGFITEDCTCTTFSDCVEDLGVVCPGLLNNSVLHNTQLFQVVVYEAQSCIPAYPLFVGHTKFSNFKFSVFNYFNEHYHLPVLTYLATVLTKITKVSTCN